MGKKSKKKKAMDRRQLPQIFNRVYAFDVLCRSNVKYILPNILYNIVICHRRVDLQVYWGWTI